MKTLYLHIGTPKTATTSIQEFCRANESLLNNLGYSYPTFSYKYPRVSLDRNAHFLVGKAYDEFGKRDNAHEKILYQQGIEMINECFKTFDHVILSDEDIWQTAYLEQPDLWQRLNTIARENHFQIKVIVYFRRQDELICSLWNQTVKTAIRRKRCKQTFQKYIKNKTEFVQLDYYGQLEWIAASIGKQNIIVKTFEPSRFQNQSIYADFLNILGIKLTDKFVIFEDNRNMGLAGNTHEIKRILNDLPEMEDRTNNNYLRDILVDCSLASKKRYPSRMFSQEETKAFLATYEDSNQKILEEYCDNQWESLFHMEIADLPKWEKNNPYMQEDIIRFVGMSTIHLLNTIQEENRKLKAEIDCLKQPKPTLLQRLKRRIFSIIHHS